mgnify:CR=1 FL=1
MVRAMKRFFLTMGFLALLTLGSAASAPLEAEGGQAIQSKRITIVHFWAPWCPNCKMELTTGGWSSFIAANPNVDFVFLTLWSDQSGDGRALLGGERGEHLAALERIAEMGGRRLQPREMTFEQMEQSSSVPTEA